MKGFWSFSNELSKKKEATELSEQTIKRTNVGSAFLFKRQRYKEDIFKLSVQETSIKGNVLGYIFRFEVNDNNDDDAGEDKSPDNKKSESVLNIDPSFVPDVTRKFALDTKKYTFYSKEKSQEEEEEKSESENYDWHMKLKELAQEKINRFKQKQKELEKEDDEEEENEEEDDSEVIQGDEEHESEEVEYDSKIKMSSLSRKVMEKKKYQDPIPSKILY